ncbi:MAG TPA: N-6 DNA methylase [Lachnospiraceae bacterium]|nr:N-6 DNA methylase [Lachnospiraceae bacterium]
MTEKKEFGQFFTSKKIAEFMTKWVLLGNPKQVLDPAVGEGIFLKLIHQLSPATQLQACEIDPKMVQRFRNNNSYQVKLYEGDYLFTKVQHKPDAIICNPPYLRFQKIDRRKEILQNLKNMTGFSFSGYTNAAAMFLVKCLYELKSGGRSAFIIPYEFLNAGYGKCVKEYLLKEKALAKIILFDSKVNVFEDALTTSCILLMEKGCCDIVEFCNLHSVEDLTDVSLLNKKRSYQYTDLDCNAKWLNYFTGHQESGRHLIPMKDYVDVKRGIATGCNSYFTLNRAQVDKLQLTEQVLHPCIVKAPDITTGILTKHELERMENSNKKMFLFDGKQATTKEELQYLKKGEESGVPQAYLTSHRHPWYSLEKTPAAPILFSVFSRNHMKIIRNETQARHLTSFHGIYLREPNDTKENANLLYCYLITPLAQRILHQSHREYANGLDKFEPGDLQNAQILDLSLIEDKDRKEIEQIYLEMRRRQIERAKIKGEMEYLEKLEEIFQKYLE